MLNNPRFEVLFTVDKTGINHINLIYEFDANIRITQSTKSEINPLDLIVVSLESLKKYFNDNDLLFTSDEISIRAFENKDDYLKLHLNANKTIINKVRVEKSAIAFAEVMNRINVLHKMDDSSSYIKLSKDTCSLDEFLDTSKDQFLKHKLNDSYISRVVKHGLIECIEHFMASIHK